MKSFLEFLEEEDQRVIGGFFHRSQLPQLDHLDHEEFRSFLSQSEVGSHSGNVPIGSLKPMQNHIDQQKVDQIAGDIKAYPKAAREWRFVVSQDHRILDGHHRWAALKSIVDPNYKVRAIVVHAPFNRVVELAHKFPKSSVEG